MADAVTEAYEMLAVYRARLAYAEKIRAQYDDYMIGFDEEIAHIEKKRAVIQKEFDQGDDIISTYNEKVSNQLRIIRHLQEKTKVTGIRASGAPIRTASPLEKLQALRRQMAKIQQELDNPDGVKDEQPSSRFSQVRIVEGIKFMRDRRTREWFYSDVGGGQVYGAFDTFTEARENASV